jgi:hypothetical protein
MPGMQPIGSFEYNAVIFDAASRVTVNTEFVKDEAGRTVTYQRTTITVRAVVAPGGGSADDSMEAIRRRLGEPAKDLIFAGRGFGNDLFVGPSQAVKDIKCGPMPEILAWEPIGSNRAAEIEWRVVVCIPACGDSAPRRTGVLAMNYDMDFKIDRHGDTTRTISGYLEVAQIRTGKFISATADAYFEKLAAPALPGFHREYTRKVSKDRSRLDFTITDIQIPSRNPYPLYVTDIRGTHRAEWSRGRYGFQIRNTIAMEITPKATVTPSYAWSLFLDVVKQRRDIARQGNTKGVLIDRIEAEEDLFGRACRFTCSYHVLACLPELMTKSGLWQPLGTNWGFWRASLADINGYRGMAGMAASSDVIVDLCGEEIYPSETQQPGMPPILVGSPIGLKNEKPPDGSDYLFYDNQVIPSSKTPVTRQSVMQQPAEESPGDVTDPTADVPFSFPAATGTADILQVSGLASFAVQLVGRAARVGRPVPRPRLAAFGSATIKETNAWFAAKIIGNALGIPIYGAVWNLAYAATKSPGRVDPPKNPKECVESDGQAHQPSP